MFLHQIVGKSPLLSRTIPRTAAILNGVPEIRKNNDYNFSTTSQKQVGFRRAFDFASYLRRIYLEKRHGIKIVDHKLYKDGVHIDSEFAQWSVATPAFLFKLERYWAAGMLPLIPAAYFIHSTPMDIALTFAIVLHSHWGLMSVVKDYARPIIVGEIIADYSKRLVTFLSILLFCGLLHFNFLDIGLTKAFELVFSL